MAQTLCLILSVLFVSGQSDDWEKYIRAVNNSQLTGNGKYLWQTVLQSKDGAASDRGMLLTTV